MAPRRLPGSVQLPTRRVVELVALESSAAKAVAARKAEGAATARARKPPRPGPFLAQALALFDSGKVAIRADGSAVDVRSLDLRDFHALRAILTHEGWLEEEPVEISCRNCERAIEHRPCAALELGPFVDRELDSPLLDVTLDLASPHAIPKVRYAGGTARTVLLSALRVEEALPLFAALGNARLRVTREVAQAMGIARLGEERSARKIARALQGASDEAWAAITSLYLEAHYSPRLFSVATCPDCGARNDVDAPYDREFGGEANPHPGSPAARTKVEVFPTFDAFAERARALADELVTERGLHGIEIIAEGGVPACDDGGEPLLGSYVPPYEGGDGNPSHPAEVTVYYRTFRAIWVEDGAYDWDRELWDTVDHELTHHEGHLAGDDPMDEEERDQIARDAEEIVGRKALARGAVFGLYRDFGDFARRTWPIWVLAFIATIVAAIGSR